MVKPVPFLSAKTVYSNAWLLWIVLVSLLYYPTYHTFPYFDDTAHVEWVVAYGASFLHHPESPMFRPFERLIIGLSWKMPGNGFWFAKTFSLAVLLLKTWLVSVLGGMLLRDRHPLLRFAVPILFLLHPMHVASVIKIDTISENLASLFALALALVVARLAFVPDEELSNGRVCRFALAAAALSLLGMLSKEAYLGVAAATPLLVSVAALRERGKSKARFALLVASGLTVAAMTAYFLLRRQAGYTLAGGDAANRYRFHLGLNFLLNAATSFGASLFPGSTLKIFVHFDLFYVLLSAALVLAAALLYLPGYLGFARCVRSGCARVAAEARVLLIFVIAAVASLVPSGLINGLISENQSEATIPFVLMLAFFIPAWMMDSATTDPSYAPLFAGSGRLAASSRRPAATMVVLAMITALMATATSEKVEAAHEMSRRAYAMGDEMMRDYLAHPVSHYFLCIPPDSFVRRKYSIFSLPDGMLASTQMYRIDLLHPSKPSNFMPDVPQARPYCSMRVSDQKLYPQTPTAFDVH